MTVNEAVQPKVLIQSIINTFFRSPSGKLFERARWFPFIWMLPSQVHAAWRVFASQNRTGANFRRPPGLRHGLVRFSAFHDWSR